MKDQFVYSIKIIIVSSKIYLRRIVLSILFIETFRFWPLKVKENLSDTIMSDFFPVSTAKFDLNTLS